MADIARAMVQEYAMGTGFHSMRLGAEGVSEATRRVGDEEVRELADEAFRGAVDLLDAHRLQLDELAATLLAKEVIERDDIDRIMAGVPTAGPARRSSTHLELAAVTAVQPSSNTLEQD